MLVGALLAYPSYVLLNMITDLPGLETLAGTPFRRVADRAFLLAGLVGLYPLAKSFKLRRRSDWGYACEAGRTKAVVTGFVAGITLLLLLLTCHCLLRVRVWDSSRNALDLVQALIGGIVSGLAIGFIEETFFRGGLYWIVSKELSPRGAVSVTAGLYALLHFLRTDDAGLDRVSWSSGFAVLGGAFAKLTDPSIVGPFLALLVLGVVLAKLRQATGHIFLNIGVHAGFVAGVRLGHEATDSVQDSPQLWLAQGYDGITGFLALFLVLIPVLVHVALRSRGRSSDEPGAAASR